MVPEQPGQARILDWQGNAAGTLHGREMMPMTRLALAQFVFRTRSEAESYVDEIKPMAWPHVWYSRDPESGNWTVTAFIQADHLSAVA